MNLIFSYVQILHTYIYIINIHLKKQKRNHIFKPGLTLHILKWIDDNIYCCILKYHYICCNWEKQSKNKIVSLRDRNIGVSIDWLVYNINYCNISAILWWKQFVTCLNLSLFIGFFLIYHNVIHKKKLQI